MQRIIPFGREYAESDDFSVDEGQKIRFWLVREDYTTTVGEAEAELQVKSAVGNDHWTTLEVLTDGKPYYDLIGTDENLVYRWVRKAGMTRAAIDRSSDATMSRVQRAPVNLGQPDFDHATLPLMFKAQAAEDVSGVFGVYDILSPAADDPSEYGTIFAPKPDLPVGAGVDSEVVAFYDPTGPRVSIQFGNSMGEDTSLIDWSEYIGGFVYLYTECPDPSTPTTFVQELVAAVDPEAQEPGEAVAIDTGLIIELLLDGDGNLDGINPERFFSEGKTFFVALRKPGQNAPSFNLGPKTGRFMLDENDIPARLSAWPFDTANEEVLLSMVEGSVVIPMIEDTERRKLYEDITTTLLEGPGEYEWERSCNSSPGVYLNTGWRV